VPEALAQYFRADSILQAINDPISQAIIQSDLGLLYLKIDSPARALPYFEAGLQIGRHAGHLQSQKVAYRGFSKTYKALGEHELALEKLNAYIELRDTSFHGTLREKAAYYQELYQTEKKAREVAELQTALTVEKKEGDLSRLQRNGAILIGILLLLLLLVTINRYRLRKRVMQHQTDLLEQEKETLRLSKELVQQKLDAKNRELSSLASQAMAKNQWLDNFSQKIDSIQRGPREQVKLALGELERMVKSNFNIEHDWQKFQQHFNQVHPHFFDTLRSGYPNLTVNDLRLCAYLRMNLTTKEIASIMNIEPQSARMKRYRLKKKMELTEEVDLQVYITQQ